MKWILIGNPKNGPTFSALAINIEEFEVVRQEKNRLDFYSKSGHLTSIETDVSLNDFVKILEENNVPRN